MTVVLVDFWTSTSINCQWKLKTKILFYVRPVEKPKQGAAWYYSIPIGRNKLAQMVPEMCRIGGISGHKSNHSLRATGATELYEAEVPEKIIQERTGHRSFECLRMYERTSEKQHQAVSNILSSSSQSTYHTQITKVDSQNIATSSNTTGLLPKMNFANCQVNVNINQGSAAPVNFNNTSHACLLYTSPSPRDATLSRMPSSA